MRAPRFTRYAWFVVLYNLGVVLWGAYVRATGSGAGCGRHWPLCNGEVLPRSPSTETLIELSHRISSGLDGLLVLALVVAAWRLFPARHRVRRVALASLIFLITEALAGAGLVRFELVVDNDSMTRAVVMAFHLVNTFLLLAFLVLTALWSGGLSRPRLKGQGSVPWLLAGALAGTLLVGMSGAVTALGDTIFPGRSFTWQDLSPTSHFLLRLRIFHPAISLVVGAVVLTSATLVARLRPAPGVRRTAVTLVALYLVQLACGLVNVELAAPVALQLVHLLLADLVWLALVALGATALAREVPQRNLAASGGRAVPRRAT